MRKFNENREIEYENDNNEGEYEKLQRAYEKYIELFEDALIGDEEEKGGFIDWLGNLCDHLEKFFKVSSNWTFEKFLLFNEVAKKEYGFETSEYNYYIGKGLRSTNFLEKQGKRFDKLGKGLLLISAFTMTGKTIELFRTKG